MRLHIRQRPAPVSIPANPNRCEHNHVSFNGTCASCQRRRARRWREQEAAVDAIIGILPGGNTNPQEGRI